MKAKRSEVFGKQPMAARGSPATVEASPSPQPSPPGEGEASGAGLRIWRWVDGSVATDRNVCAPETMVRAFTLLELLVVIAIIGILAAIAVPTMNSFKPNVMAAATEQLLGDVARARQLALSQRTTVYMVFVPTNFWNDQVFVAGYPTWPAAEKAKVKSLYDKQLVGYAFVALKQLGDQPGQHTARYLSPWRTLPEGAFIPLQKFSDPLVTAFPVFTNKPPPMLPPKFWVWGFQRTTSVPFPSESTPGVQGSDGSPTRWTTLPYIAFNYTGQLVDPRRGVKELIPLARGSVMFPKDPVTKEAKAGLPSALENPPGNSTNSAYHLVNVDWLTGRAHVERQEVK